MYPLRDYMDEPREENKITYIPPTEFVKLPKVVRDNYLEMAAELAVIHGLYGGQKMPVIKNMGFYAESEKVGYVAWIETIDGTYFIDVDGKITKPEM